MSDETTFSRLERSRQRLRRLVAEPVTIFVVLAAGIFAYDALSSDDTELDAVVREGALETIVVSDEILSALENDFEWLHGRPPTDEESRRLAR